MDLQVLIVANPYSGAKRNRELVEALPPLLARHGLSAQIVWDLAQRTQLLQDPSLSARCRCVIVAGGDGTIGSVVNELTSPTPLAILPLGNENLLARELDFTLDLEALGAAIARGQIRQLDLGQAKTRKFTLMLSVGFDAEVVHHLAAWRTRRKTLRRVTHLSYAWPIMSAFVRYRHEPIELQADGRRVRGHHALIFNLPRYGGKLDFLPRADGQDGALDWLVLQRPGRLALVDYWRAIRRGEHLNRPDVQHGRAMSIRLHSESPLPAQIDGDPSGFTPLEVRVLAGALRVVAV